MTKLIQIAHLFLLVCVSTLCLAGADFLYHANHTLTKLDSVVTDVDSMVKRVSLLEKQTEFLVLNAGLTMEQVRKESAHESTVLDAVNSSVQKSLMDLDGFVLSSTQNEAVLLQSANTVTQNINPVLSDARQTLQQTTATIAEAQKATVALQVVIADPSIPKALAATQTAAEQTAVTMQHVSATTGDVQQAVHSYLHPKWYTTVTNWVIKIGAAVIP